MFRAATLYTVIKRLLEDGLITKAPRAPIPRWTTSGGVTTG